MNNNKENAVHLSKSNPNGPYSDDMDELALVINKSNEPNIYKEAITSPIYQEWQKAIIVEIQELEQIEILGHSH